MRALLPRAVVVRLRGISLAWFAAAILAASCVREVPLKSAPETALLSCRQPASADAADLVQWIAAESENDRPSLDAWCRGVGPIVYHEASSPEVPLHTRGPLAVVSWNVNVGAGDLAALVADLRSGRF
jgi:hypothetical protein